MSSAYAIVSQTNWRVPIRRPDGSLVFQLGFRAPPSMQDAYDWPGTYVIEQPCGKPPPRVWGHGTYAERNGDLVLVADDFDTSD